MAEEIDLSTGSFCGTLVAGGAGRRTCASLLVWCGDEPTLRLRDLSGITSIIYGGVVLALHIGPGISFY